MRNSRRCNRRGGRELPTMRQVTLSPHIVLVIVCYVLRSGKNRLGPDEPPGIVRGYVCYDDTPICQKEPREIAIDRARIAMAGMIAGGIRAGSRYRDHDWVDFGGRASAGDDDLEEMKRFLEDAGIPNENQRQPYLKLRAMTRRLLATPRNWAAVEAIADALVRHETLTGEIAIAIITPAKGSEH